MFVEDGEERAHAGAFARWTRLWLKRDNFRTRPVLSMIYLQLLQFLR